MAFDVTLLFEFSVGIGAFIIRLSHLSSFFSWSCLNSFLWQLNFLWGVLQSDDTTRTEFNMWIFSLTLECCQSKFTSFFLRRHNLQAMYMHLYSELLWWDNVPLYRRASTTLESEFASYWTQHKRRNCTKKDNSKRKTLHLFINVHDPLKNE